MAVERPKGKKSVPEGVWTECKKCKEIIYNKDLEKNFKICPKCGYYFRLSAYERIGFLLDKDSFKECDVSMKSNDPLSFHDTRKYVERLKDARKKTNLFDAILTGEGQIGKHNVSIGVMDFRFMGGSMGSVVGEKITRSVERAIEKKTVVIIVSTSGGARMQEGMFSLMQMAKTSAALSKLNKKKLPFISVLTDPTTAGVSASFAMLGDVIISEPKALIGFAGPRVIEQTIQQKLPEGFQSAEFLLEHGIVDLIVERKDMRNTIIKLLEFFENKDKVRV
ncbi:acetyl-CoA carboxylase carboxyltransferase subunit beta [bacterium]|nr:acetyl-CoA carboxylase carboxyltransferase subunit beta [bacterium]